MKLLQLYFLLATLSIQGFCSTAQQSKNLKDLSTNSQPDTNRVKLLLQLTDKYYFTKPDSCLVFAKEAIELSQKLSFRGGELRALNIAGESLRFLGEFPQALEMQYRALEIYHTNHNLTGEATTLGFIGLTYLELNEFRQGLNYLYQANGIYNSLSNPIISTFNLSNIGYAYERMNMLDSALYYQQQARDRSINLPHGNLKILILSRLGLALERLGNKVQALQYYREALQSAFAIGDKVNPGKIQYRIAELYRSINEQDSSIYYARLSYMSGSIISQKLQVLETSNLLAKLFRNDAPDSVIFYQDIAIAMNDSLYGPHKLKQLQLLMLSQQEEQQKIQQEQQQYKNRTRLATLLTILGLFLIIVIILFRNNRHKQKVNTLLQEKNEIIEKALLNLKTTQHQLIQSEKMASLGELTAGIAHEIQNPLNFVNNFSELNKELVAELNEELKNGRVEDAKSIANNIQENSEKIHLHGQRAESIVKGMLQHSRKSTGVKEPTDINTLADEYVRLSYHGLRAKDKSLSNQVIQAGLSAGQAGFNSVPIAIGIKMDLDPTLPLANVVPQDIGRVFLNLVNNAFQAVMEEGAQRRRLGDLDYKPVVSVKTQLKADSSLLISVKDNGPGIPDAIKDKIFQPFFTTKPAGQGTGLGLSLAYDIVTKGHNGTIECKSVEKEGTEFIITLPLESI